MEENNINLSELKLLLEKHFAQTEKQFADMRKDNAEFREQMKDNMNSFKSSVRYNTSSNCRDAKRYNRIKA